jgi:hypothetical protein
MPVEGSRRRETLLLRSCSPDHIAALTHRMGHFRHLGGSSQVALMRMRNHLLVTQR